MGANLKQNNHTKIGNVLKSVSHDLVFVSVLNCCTNFHELAKKAEKHELPMIAIKHAAQDMLSVFETNKINEIPGKFKEAVNLNEEYTQYGTNHWKRKPSGYATRPHGEKWYGRYNCPFRKWCGYADYREFSLIPDLFKKSDDLRNVDPLTLLFFGSVLKKHM